MQGYRRRRISGSVFQAAPPGARVEVCPPSLYDDCPNYHAGGFSTAATPTGECHHREPVTALGTISRSARARGAGGAVPTSAARVPFRLRKPQVNHRAVPPCNKKIRLRFILAARTVQLACTRTRSRQATPPPLVTARQSHACRSDRWLRPHILTRNPDRSRLQSASPRLSREAVTDRAGKRPDNA